MIVEELEILEDDKGEFYFSIKISKNIPDQTRDAIVNLLEKEEWQKTYD